MIIQNFCGACQRLLFVVICSLWLGGCASSFQRPDADMASSAQNDAEVIFARVLQNHGGNRLDQLTDVNVSLRGRWRFLIKRIQPLVTDYEYRVDSEERLLLKNGVYTALYTGPAGQKKVVRTRDDIRVFYNEQESFDDDVLGSSAMTADAFYYFLLGPLSLANQAGNFTLLADARDKGRDYHRLYTSLKPGFGLSAADELILWVDAESLTAYRMEITLEGFETTRGAHVDVTFLDFEKLDGFLLPVSFHERVRAPIRIHAHSWELTGLDINRGLIFDAVDGPGWLPPADASATPR